MIYIKMIANTNTNANANANANANELRKFQCNHCQQSKFVLKKVWNQQHHGFACDACWATIEKQSRYNCIIG